MKLTCIQIFFRTALFSVVALFIIYSTSAYVFAADLPELPQLPEISDMPNFSDREPFPRPGSSLPSEDASSEDISSEDTSNEDTSSGDTPSEDTSSDPVEILPPEELPPEEPPIDGEGGEVAATTYTMEENLFSIRTSLELLVYFIIPLLMAVIVTWVSIRWFDKTFCQEYFL